MKKSDQHFSSGNSTIDVSRPALSRSLVLVLSILFSHAFEKQLTSIQTERPSWSGMKFTSNSRSNFPSYSTKPLGLDAGLSSGLSQRGHTFPFWRGRISPDHGNILLRKDLTLNINANPYSDIFR